MEIFRLTDTQPAETPAHQPRAALPLGRRVRAGISLNLSSSVITEFIRFARSVMLARLLVPEDFGLFGMALTIVGALTALSTLGLSRTIVTSKFETTAELRSHLNTVWSLEILRGFVIALVVSASAYPISLFYRQAQLKVIIPTLGLVALVQGFQNIGLVLLRKEISFARIFWYELATNAGGIVITLILAVIMRNVWALVIGMLLTSALGTALSYIFHSFRPRFAFESHAVRRVLSLGKLTLVIAVASYVMNMGDNVMVGRLLGTSALGNYSLAFNIASAPISVLVFSINTVLFPAFAEITARRPNELKPAFTKVFSFALMIIVMIAAPLFLLASEVIQVLFGSNWATAGTVLPILALVIPLRGLSMIISTFVWGLNRPKDVAVAATLEAVVFLAALYPLIRVFGLTGAAWAGMIAYSTAGVSRLITLNKIMPGISANLFRISLSILAATGTGLLIAWVSLIPLTSPLPRMIFGGLLTTIIPTAILLWFKADLRKSLIDWLS
ncbi:MAG: oligosaccharide flippase family protein [Pyrinomonadaceae bacterium]